MLKRKKAILIAVMLMLAAALGVLIYFAVKGSDREPSAYGISFVLAEQEAIHAR